MKANMVKHYFEPLYISDFSAPLHDIVETLVNILRYAETLGVSDVVMRVAPGGYEGYEGDPDYFEVYGFRNETKEERLMRLKESKKKRIHMLETQKRKDAEEMATYIRLKKKFEGGK